MVNRQQSEDIGSMNQYPFSQKQKDSGIAQAIPFHYSGQKKKDLPVLSLPGGALLSHSRTIVAAAALNFCVRDGYRCARRAFSTRFRGSSLKAGRITLSSLLWPGPRPISAGPLSMSPCLHSRSINLVVFEGP